MAIKLSKLLQIIMHVKWARVRHYACLRVVNVTQTASMGGYKSREAAIEGSH